VGLYRRYPGGNWWMSYTADGRQVFESTREKNRKRAQQKLDIRRAEIAQGRFDVLKLSPKLGEWSEKYLNSIQHANTRRRYACSRVALISFLGEETLLSHISAARINEFVRVRRDEKVKAATINRDLQFLAQILKQAERERCVGRSPFGLGKFRQNESRERRKPYILTWEEQAKLLSVARPRIRMLIVLGTETGMRTGEMLSLRWRDDVDFLNDTIRVERAKTPSGARIVPMSTFCKSELLRWRNLIGNESEFVFPSFENKRHRLQGGRKAWASTLKEIGIPYFPIYNLRHAYATRLTAAGVPALTIASLLGHSSTQIVPRYAQVLDQNRIDAMKKLEALRQSAPSGESASQPTNAEPVQVRH
jgi:integrase